MDYSAIVGLIIKDTRLSLSKFFEIILLMNYVKMGMSAPEIFRAAKV